jgi:hypothetical protein
VSGDASFDPRAAGRFLAAHGRLLDRHRFALATAPSPGAARAAAGRALGALEAYRNPDGGFGWGLEPDLRAPESQPVSGLHAFEVLAEAASVGVTSPLTVPLCDFLADASLDDGGVPFALPISDPTACAPFWAAADPTVASLQITAAVVGPAARTARHDPTVREHPWFDRAVRYCLRAIAERVRGLGAYELMFSLAALDALAEVGGDAERTAEARRLLGEVAATIPDGPVPVEGGAPGEVLHPIQLAPFPGPAREHVADEAIVADLRRLAAEQRPDGGWDVDFESSSPIAALEWRGYTTVQAVRVLLANG